MVIKTISETRLIGLVFFFILFSCKKSDSTKEFDIELVWTESKVTCLHISDPAGKFRFKNADLEVQLLDDGQDQRVLGDFEVKNGGIQFFPLVALTPKLSYKVSIDGALIGTISIPEREYSASPELGAVYPLVDTIPENLLKMHLVFSKPMAEGQWIDHVIVLAGDMDTLHGTFLDLKPELWNNDATVLTLWLDPGRIKRDLVPNQTLGTPLHEGQDIKILILGGWRALDGSILENDYIKRYTVTESDREMPDIGEWRIILPDVETKDELQIYFGEALDYLLVQSALHIEGPKSEVEVLEGKISIINSGKACSFKPAGEWRAGEYVIVIETRLEDAAGNNLIRLFDSDLKEGDQVDSDAMEMRLLFEIIP